MFRIRNIRTFGLILLLTAAAVLLNLEIVLAEEAGVNFSGAFEVNGISQVLNENALFPNPDLPTFGDSINFRGDFGLTPSEQVRIKLRLSYQDNTLQSAAANGAFTLSRGYIDLTPNNSLSFRFGKQRLAWGTGYAWNPTDLLDQKRNAFTPSDDPEGIVAFRADVNCGPATGQIFLVPGASWDSSGQAVRVKTSPFGMDLTLGLVKPGTDDTALTTDFACSIAGIGLHGEVLYQKEGNWRSDKTDVLNYLVGADYNLPGGFCLALEYYHNDEAFKDISELIYYLISQALDPEESQKFVMDQSNNGGITRDHLFLRCTKAIGADGNAELLMVYNTTDKSLIAQPKLSYILGQNTEIFVKGLIISGQGNVEANLSPVKDQLNFGVKVNF